MPLYEDAHHLIENNLRDIGEGYKVHVTPIGVLTLTQLADINANQAALGLRAIDPEIVFVGGHIHERRIIFDGYTIDDVLDQIKSALNHQSTVVTESKLTAIENPNPRDDKYKNWVLDRGVFRLDQKHSRPELFSVIPKGDVNKPK